MKRYLKPILVGFTLLAALFLTFFRSGPEQNGLGFPGLQSLRAAPERTAKHYDLSALKVFNVALMRIKDNYVDPKRIDPRQMFTAALDGVEKSVAEVLVEEVDGGKAVNVKVDSFEKRFNVADIDSPWALSSRIKSVMRFLQPHLRKGTEIQEVEYAAINGMLATLDPHSLLLTPETYNEMKLSTRGEFGGLGIVISMVKGVLTVMNPMKNTPADQAGIKACDRIVKIGEESTVNMTLSQAVSRLRGAPGSKIEITVQRPDSERPTRKTLTRAIIKVPSVTSQMLENKVAYIKLSSFQGNTHDDLRQELAQLRKQGMRGLILDLRGNPGGLLDQSIKVSDLFLESGTLVSTVSHAGKQREEKRAHNEGTEPHYPMAVLVSSGSASASEIVAGALKNLDRAVVIGTRTFGKGSVQVLYDNDDGSALKLTIAQYLTPGDVSIQSVGITPDIATAPVLIRKERIRLIRADKSRREQDLDKHLTHRNAKLDAKPQQTLLYLAERQPQDEEEEEDLEPLSAKKNENLCLYPDRECKAAAEDDAFREDFHIRLAKDLLAQAQAQGWRRSQVLAAAGSFFSSKQQAEEQRIAKELKKLGVDWNGQSSAQGKPKIKVAVETDPREGKGLACRKMSIKVTVTNEGGAPTSQLRAVSSSTNKLFDGHEFVFGKVAPGASRSWTVPVDVRDAPTRVDDVTFKFHEANNNTPPPYTLPLAIRGVDRPTFAYGYQLIDDLEANQDGQAQLGEKVRLFVKVRNTGQGTSFRTITTLTNLSGPGIFIRKGLFVLGELAPGETKNSSFTFDVQPSFDQDEFKVELTVYDDALREYVTDKLTFKIAPSQSAPQQANGAVRVTTAGADLRAWGAADAAIVGTAERGAAFQVLGRTSGWYRVLASPSRPAFISAQQVAPATAAALQPKKSGFHPRWQVTPPKLALKSPEYSTTKKSIRIEGAASDEHRVSDLFIFVRNPDAKIEGRKVYYRSNTNSQKPQELRFLADIPLWPGANYITVHARESAEVQAQETLVIFRKKDELLAEKAAAAAAKQGTP